MSKLAIVERNKLNLGEVSILVVGGAPIEVEVLIQVFTGFGAGKLRRVDGVAQGKLEMRNSADLVVMDAKLGAEACFDFIRWVRRTPGNGRFCPIILTTANPAPSLVSGARDSGANYVVAKPLTPRVLFERMLYVVKEGRPFVECPTYAGPDRRFHKLGPPTGTQGRRHDDVATPAESADDEDASLGAPPAPPVETTP